MAACVRSRRPRRLSMFEMWFLTVPSLITSCSAISRFVAPLAIRRSTSTSRLVRSTARGDGVAVSLIVDEAEETHNDWLAESEVGGLERHAITLLPTAASI